MTVRAAALALALSACGPGARPPPTPTVPTAPGAPPTAVRTLPAGEQGTAGPLRLAADAHHQCWTTSEGVACSRDGAAPVVRAVAGWVSWMAIVGDAVVYRAEAPDGVAALWALPLAGGAPRQVSGAGAVGAVDADADGVAWSEGERVRLLDRGLRASDGPAVGPIADGPPQEGGGALGLGVDGGWLYWARPEPSGDDDARFSIVRAPRHPGAASGAPTVEVVARGERPIVELAAGGGQVCWSTLGGGVGCAGPAGVRHPLVEGDGALGAGPLVTYVPPEGGALVVLPAAGAPRLYLPPRAGARWAPSAAPVALADGLVAATLDADGDYQLWRLPLPGADTATLLRSGTGEVRRMVAAGGAVYTVEGQDDGDPTAVPVDRVMATAADGATRTLATGPAIEALAAAGDAVAWAVPPDDSHARATLWLAEGSGRPRVVTERAGNELLGLTLTARALYWVADAAIWSAARSGGHPTLVHEPTWGDAGGSGEVSLVVDGRSVYFSSVGLGATGVHRTRGGADATELWPAPEDGLGDELVQVGGAVYVVSGRRTLWQVPMAGGPARSVYAAPDGQTLGALVAGGGRVYLAATDEVEAMVLVLDPASPASGARPLVHLGGAQVRMAADEHGLYLAHDDARWLVRVPHDAGAEATSGPTVHGAR